MRSPFLAAAALAVGVAACGGNGGSPDERAAPTPPPTTATQPEPTTTAPPVPPTPPETDPGATPKLELVPRPLWIGFQDDPSFRWQPHRAEQLDSAASAGATVLRTTVVWRDAAPRRPADPTTSFDPAYRLADVDELVRNAQLRGLEVLITIWGTPSWANGGLGPNRVPRRLEDLTDFAQALADRYSGRNAGYPYVRFFSIWNEPNLEQFLAPQFDDEGGSLSPGIYAQLFEAAAAGIRRASPTALIAAGETSPRGRNRRLESIQDSHAPGTFARLVAEAAPDLDFDAWAHHPYPTAFRRPPTQQARWPNIALTQIDRLGESVDEWFGRGGTPVWITEYAYETRPEDEKGVIAAVQARFAAEAVQLAAANPRIAMFIWFTFRDDRGNPWQSGVLGLNGKPKPAYRSFAAAARPRDARAQVAAVEDDAVIVRLGVRPFAQFSERGASISLAYRLRDGRRLASRTKPRGVPLGNDAWITARVPLEPQPGTRYRIEFEAIDPHGNIVRREVVLVAR